MALSRNDLMVLSYAERACQEYDGFAPHGPIQWIGARRLILAGLLQHAGTEFCEECDSALHRASPTEVPIIAITDEGKRVHQEHFEAFAHTDPTCPTCRDHGIYGDVNEETGDVVETYCPCAIGEARRPR